MTIAGHSAETTDRTTGSPLEVLLVFLRLGVTCFGGPIAHIGYFRDEFVVRRRCSTSRPMPISWVCVSSCPAPPAAKSGFPSV
jgi:chromate transporter